MANGDLLTRVGVCCDMEVQIDQEIFHLDCYAIILGECNVVLGVQWLHILGPILWDFDRIKMSFWWTNHHVTWQATAGQHTTPGAHACTTRDLLADLFTEFEDILAKPVGLSPLRVYNQRIHLLPRTPLVVVRPYRYPTMQKDELERQCTDMLRQGLIRCSTSEYSLLVLFIKKNDGVWRFCINYCVLNDKTVKDKFPIPLVDELLDELKGDRFFTKLNLRSGYHQVRMHEPGIKKTTFHTNDGLFQFVVMPFGLTNAPATFQALMNAVLYPALWCFVLVFFMAF